MTPRTYAGPAVPCIDFPRRVRRCGPRPTLRRRHMPDQNNGRNVGKIVEIKGVVIDAVFPDTLPSINNAVSIQMPDGATLISEVQQHLGDDRVRVVAMDSTDGLARGIDV